VLDALEVGHHIGNHCPKRLQIYDNAVSRTGEFQSIAPDFQSTVSQLHA
jgi:hypothetical protein